MREILRWQRPAAAGAKCARCKKAAARQEYARTEQAEPDASTLWVPLCFVCHEDGSLEGRMFAGVYPAGIVYADTWREARGDYMELGFLPYKSLEFVAWEGWRSAPEWLRAMVRAHVEGMRAKRGEYFPLSTVGRMNLERGDLSQCVRLGS